MINPFPTATYSFLPIPLLYYLKHNCNIINLKLTLSNLHFCLNQQQIETSTVNIQLKSATILIIRPKLSVLTLSLTTNTIPSLSNASQSYTTTKHHASFTTSLDHTSSNTLPRSMAYQPQVSNTSNIPVPTYISLPFLQPDTKMLLRVLYFLANFKLVMAQTMGTDQNNFLMVEKSVWFINLNLN